MPIESESPSAGGEKSARDSDSLGHNDHRHDIDLVEKGGGGALGKDWDVAELHQQTSSAQPEQPPAAATPTGPGPVPDGGTQAWLQVLGGWMLFFNTW